MPGATASAVLKAATRRVHSELESQVDWARAFSERSTYASLLRSFRRVQRPADRALETGLLADYPHAGDRRTWRCIENDLDALGLAPSAADLAESDADFTWVQSAPQAAGVLYVLEGSTLGGAILSRLAGSLLGLRPESGASYFAAYGHESTARWRDTRSWIDAVLDESVSQALATHAAVKTFASFRAVLQEGKP